MANLLDTIYAIWLREVKKYSKSKARVVGSGGQPLIWLAIFGVGLGSVFALAGLNYTTFVAPGLIGMTLLFSSIFAGINVIWDKQFGFLKEILVAPVPRAGIVIGKLTGSATVAMINALVILAVVLIFGIIPLSYLTPIGFVTALVFMLLISVIFVGIGLIIATMINNVEGFQVIINFLVLPLFFLSGAIFPLTSAPLWMKGLSFIDPLTYGVDGLRGALLGVHFHTAYPLYVDLLVVLAIAVILMLISDLAFRKIEAK